MILEFGLMSFIKMAKLVELLQEENPLKFFTGGNVNFDSIFSAKLLRFSQRGWLSMTCVSSHKEPTLNGLPHIP
jgi:hypothetical protein